MLSNRATRHAAALRALLGIGALRDLGPIEIGDGMSADAEHFSRLVLAALDDAAREGGSMDARWAVIERYIERAHAGVTGMALL